MRAEIITIGDELLRGEIVDSNKSFLSERLLELDIESRWHSSTCDVPDDMTDAFRRAAGRSDVVLVSGGLGPTRDDLTTEVLASTFGRELVLDEPSLAGIREFFRRVGREMAENNAKQAWFPRGAEVLENPVGTAPGFMLEVEIEVEVGVERSDCVFFCMPGVPRELYKMMDEQVLPRLAERQRTLGGERPAVRRALLLRTFGMGESTLDQELLGIAGKGDEGDVVLGFRTAFPDNYLRPVARGRTAEEADRRLADVSAAIRERLGALVYGEGDETMEEVVGRLLCEHGKTIAIVESGTGGRLVERLTTPSGARDYFLGGVVTTSGALGADWRELLPGAPEQSAVSDVSARALAEGARSRFGADFGIATLGAEEPALEGAEPGLVYVALAHAGGTHSEGFVFPLDRARHRMLTCQVGLDWVRRSLLGVELVGPTLLRRQGGASAAYRGSTGRGVGR